MTFRPGDAKPENSGRRPNVTNKLTRDIREMIHDALSRAGGVSYLVKQSALNPVAFMGLVGKIVPAQIDATIRRELPEMTREELLAIVQAGLARQERIPHKSEPPLLLVEASSTETASAPEPQKRK